MHLNPASPYILLGKKVSVNGTPCQVPHVHNPVEDEGLIVPVLLESGGELEVFHFLDLLIHVEGIEIV
jgi:hypothetical protein